MIRDVQLRAADDSDLQAITHVLEASGLYLADTGTGAALYHVAVWGETIVGCAYGEQHGETFVVHNVAVLPEYRGHQIASYVGGALLMRARAAGCVKAVVLMSEHPGFFAKYGFSLKSVDSLVREHWLPDDVVQRFGAQKHYMCRRLD